MKTVYLVRHSQSEGNTKSLFQAVDSPLSEKGRRQANSIAERCSQLPIEVIVTSPTRRAAMTAEVVAERLQAPVFESDLFQEHKKPSVLIGRALNDERVQAVERAWIESLAGGPRVDDSENFLDLRARAGEALDYVTGRPEDHLLVITHGIFLKMLVARAIYGSQLTGREFLPFLHSLWIENAGLTTLWHKPEYPDGRPVHAEWVLWTWNDHAHLG